MTWNCDACGCCCCMYGDLNVVTGEYGGGFFYNTPTITGDAFNILAEYGDAASCEIECINTWYAGEETNIVWQSCEDGVYVNRTDPPTTNIACPPCNTTISNPYLLCDEVVNPDYDPGEPIDESNSPTICDPDCVDALPPYPLDYGNYCLFAICDPVCAAFYADYYPPHLNPCDPAVTQNRTPPETYCCEGGNTVRYQATVTAGFKVTSAPVTIRLQITGKVEKHDGGFDCASAVISPCITGLIPGTETLSYVCNSDTTATASLCSAVPTVQICGCEMETVSGCDSLRGNCITATLNRGTYIITAVFDTIDGQWHKDAWHRVEIIQTAGAGGLEICPLEPGLFMASAQSLKVDSKALIRQARRKAYSKAFLHQDVLKVIMPNRADRPVDDKVETLSIEPDEKKLARQRLINKLQNKTADKGCGCGGKKVEAQAAPAAKKKSIKML